MCLINRIQDQNTIFDIAQFNLILHGMTECITCHNAQYNITLQNITQDNIT